MPLPGQRVRALIESIAPKRFAMDRDATGLQVGTWDKPISKVLVTLDTTPAVAREAAEKGCELILSHHAVIFRPLEHLRTDSGKGPLLEDLIKSDVAVYVPHTAMDIAPGGLNDALAERLGLTKTEFLEPTGSDDATLLLAEDLSRAECHPSRKAASKAKQWAKSGAAPYEIALGSHGEPRGIGRIGELPQAMSLEAFAAKVLSKLDAPFLRLIGERSQTVQKVAVLCGDGNRFLRAAAFKGADVLVTGDVYYHTALEARSLGLALLDPGHNATERLCRELWKTRLEAALAAEKLEGLEVIPSEVETEPFDIVTA